MSKKTAALLLALLLLGSGAVWANGGDNTTVLTPGDAFYDSIKSVRTSQFTLAEDLLEQALIQNELANQLVDAMMEEDDAEYLDELFSDLNDAESSIVQLMSVLAEGENPEGEDPEGENPEGEDPEGSDPEVEDPEGEDEDLDEIISGSDSRGWRLREKVADETLPAHVRANAQKALDNQARAMERAAWARSNEGGPPPWANGLANRNSGGDDGLEDEDDGDEDGAGDGGEVATGGSTVDVLGQGPAASGNGNNGNGSGNSNIKDNNSNGNSNGKGVGLETAPGQQKKK